MIKPHGSDALNPLYVYDDAVRAALVAEAASLPSLLVNSAAAANAVMLAGGYFNPLTGYMNLADSLAVSENLHTTSGLFFPVPVVNRVEDASGVEVGSRIALLDPNVEGNPVLAIMNVEGIDTASDDQINTMTEQVFGTLDSNHPGASTFLAAGNTFLSGPIQVLSFSYFQADFPDTFRTAVEIREEIAANGWEKVVAFQTRNPMHRAHEELCTLEIGRAHV